MDSKSPVLLWVVLSMGTFLLVGIYVAAQRTAMLPKPIESPRPTQVPINLRSTNTPNRPATTSSTSASSGPDCLVFDSLEEANKNPLDVCDLILGDKDLTEVP